MRKIMVTFSLAIIFIIPFVVSVEDSTPAWSTSCINSSYIYMVSDTQNVSDGTSLLYANRTVNCPYGCNIGLGICNKWPENALPGEYIILFQIVAFAMLGFGIFRLDSNYEEMRITDIIIPLLAFFLFLTLALQANNVIDIGTGEYVRLVMIIWFDYGMAVFCLFWFFLSLLKYFKKEVT